MGVYDNYYKEVHEVLMYIDKTEYIMLLIQFVVYFQLHQCSIMYN